MQVAIDWTTVRFDVPGQPWWDWASPQWGTWMQIAPLPPPEALPQVIGETVPVDVAQAEVCFRLPDGWSVCVPPGIWADSYRNKGYPEISGSSPEFLPPVAAAGDWQTAVVVPTDAAQEIPGDETTMPGHSEQGWIDWGIGEVYDWLNPATTPIYNFAGPGATAPALTGPTGTAMTPNGTCGKSPCVCGVDSCGRPALIDPRTGKRCYRRRRRRLLTEGDFNDLMRIATLPNKQNVTVALAKAIGRR